MNKYHLLPSTSSFSSMVRSDTLSYRHFNLGEILQRAHSLKKEKTPSKGISLNSSSVKQGSKNLLHSSPVTLSSLGTPSMHGPLISRLPAFDAFQRGFTNCFHAFSNLFHDSFWPTLLCFTQILCSFPPFPLGDKALIFWKMSFYFYWAPLLCLSACSTSLVFLTDAM